MFIVSFSLLIFRLKDQTLFPSLLFVQCFKRFIERKEKKTFSHA